MKNEHKELVREIMGGMFESIKALAEGDQRKFNEKMEEVDRKLDQLPNLEEY